MKKLLLLGLVLVVLSTAACGQKGPLYVPFSQTVHQAIIR